MKQVFFGLCIFFLSLFSYPAHLFADAPPAAPLTPNPETGAPSISFPLQLDWEDIPGAQSYRYELIGYQENGEPKEFLVIRSQSDTMSPDVLKFLESRLPEKQLWHVRACQDAEETTCGLWSQVWDFTYLPGPPSIDSFSPKLEGTNVKLPVTLQWGKVVGAQSYLLNLPVLPAILSLLTKEERESAGLQPSISNEYKDEECLFTRNSFSEWAVASCLDTDSAFCGPFQQSSFYTAFVQPPLSAPNLIAPLFDPAKPDQIPLVSIASTLSWSGSPCAYLYTVKITRESDGEKIEFLTNEVQSESVRMDGQGEKEIDALKRFWQDSKNLNQVFSWQVTPCWANPFGVGADCSYQPESQQWKFRTSAIAPTLQKPEQGELTKIPILLSWKGDGVSYRYQVKNDTGFNIPIEREYTTQKTSVELAYDPPLIVPGANYWWRVKTCVDEKGEVCGEWSWPPSFFDTYHLLAPSTPNPMSEGTIFLNESVSWENVDAANAYAYHLEYACRNEKENKEECVVYGTKVCPDTSAIKIIEDNKITVSNSFQLPYCMGQYEWKVLACLQDKCQDPPETRTTWSNGGTAWKLTALQPLSAGAGLVPCGRLSNDDATPYDETEKCQLKHAGFLLQNLLDFILWKVSLFVLLILAVITGATSYFSLGGPNALARIKAVFRSFFVGFLVLVFAWMLVNIVLMLFGFKFEFFGRWWEISF